jgi:PAS domain S-box-containing protein
MPSTPAREISAEQREELTSLLLRNLRDYAIILLGPMGHVATWDEGAQRLLGYAADEILGQHFSVFFTPEDVAQGRPDREIETARTMGQADDENWLVRRDGSRLWVMGSSTALRGDNGALRGFAKIVRDISERKYWEDALAQSERRFRALIEQSADAIVLNDAQGTITGNSPALTRLLGYRRDEIVGRFAGDLIHPDDHERIAALFADCLQHDRPVGPADYRVRRKDGSWCWVEGTATNLLADPAVQAVVINVHDVTERKQAEERLADQEERFRLLVQHSSDIITILDPDGTVLYHSPSLETLLGYTPAEREGRNIFATPLVHPDDAAALRAMLRQAIDQPEALVHAECRFRHKGGRWRWIEVIARNLLHDPRVGGIIVNSRDITERRDYEQRQDDFISIAVHELRAPLTGLQGFAQVLARRAAREGHSDLVEIVPKITQQVSRLNILVQELLDVSRLQTGHLAFDLQPVALNAIVSDIVQEIQPLAPGHRLVIAETEPVIVRADALKTAQVLRNLLLNAIKYSPDADRVIVRITHEDSMGRVRIQDFGVGIPAEEQERVFERFGRVQATRDRFAGLGLGLYITKGLVEGQGGTIGVESRPGAGATFSFTLPLWDEERLLAT